MSLLQTDGLNGLGHLHLPALEFFLHAAKQLPATTVKSPPSVAVRLDIAGDPLIASVTRDAVRDLDLKFGSAVTALIKSAAFDPLSVGKESVDSQG